VAQSNYDKLRDLEWLVGEWNAERDGVSLKMKAEWVQDRNFISCKYDVKKANGTEAIDMQVIGWILGFSNRCLGALIQVEDLDTGVGSNVVPIGILIQLEWSEMAALPSLRMCCRISVPAVSIGIL